MTTRLSDVIEPALWSRYLLQVTTAMSRLIQSGIAVVDPLLQSQISAGGMTYNLPFWNDLADTEANISSDNPASSATPEKIGTGQDVAVKHARNQAFSAADLVDTVIGEDPMGVMASRVAEYWTRQDQAMLIAALLGIELDNAANDAGDMIHNAATDAVGTPSALELVGAETVLEAAQTMGDAKSKLVALCMHSRPYTELQRQNAIVYRDTTTPSSTQPSRSRPISDARSSSMMAVRSWLLRIDSPPPHTSSIVALSRSPRDLPRFLSNRARSPAGLRG